MISAGRRTAGPFRLGPAAALLLLVAAAACAKPLPHLRLATTTSTDNSGLLDYLLPDFEAQCGCRVDVIAVGTGKALRLGKNGDVDVVLVHDREREEEFLEQGYGLYRRQVMANDFVILGSPSDPAGLGRAESLDDAMMRIAETATPFFSRGDESGTHSRERALWKHARVTPAGPWYRESGLGMGATLQVASESGGYTLCDRGTYLAMREGLDLAIVYQGGSRLLNPYGVIPVATNRAEGDARRLAEAFSAWITGADAQGAIGRYRRDGQILFHPAKRSAEGAVE